MSVTYTDMRTASESLTPACAQTVVRFSRHWRTWSPIEPSTSAPVVGAIGTWPEQNSRPPEGTAELNGHPEAGRYGPAGAGASGAVTGWRCDTGTALLSEGADRAHTSGPVTQLAGV